MGLFSRLFSGSSVSGHSSGSGVEEPLTCDSCGCTVEEEEMEEGMCPDCYNSDYSGDKYCCGAIYEDGEDTCASCGEPL